MTTVAVIGAGIIGAAVAYRLAEGGAEVHLIEAGPGPASGVTRQAFGWINTVIGDPANLALYGLRRRAMESFVRLSEALPEAFASARRGSVIWEKSAGETERLAAAHAAAGADARLVEASVLAKMEPSLLKVPELAVHSPGDIALDPAVLAQKLANTAQAHGSTLHFNAQVDRIETAGGRVIGIGVDGRTLPVDFAVIAAGTGSITLTNTLGMDIGMHVDPILMLRFSASRRYLRSIVRSPELEVRQAADNTFLVPEYLTEPDPDLGYQPFAETVKENLERHISTKEDIVFQSASVGRRPMFGHGHPVCEFSRGVDSLYICAGHPEVIFAPLLSEIAAGEILTGDRPSWLRSWL